MKRASAALVLLLSVAITGIACTESDAADGPSSLTVTTTVLPVDTPRVPASDTPYPVPGAFFGTPSGATGRLIEGTRCWGNSCIDMVGPITAAGPVSVLAGEPIDLLIEGTQPSQLNHIWFDVRDMEPGPANDGLVAWADAYGEPYQAGDITVPLAPGSYVLSVFAQWDPGGDITFSAYLDVRDPRDVR